MEPHEQPCYVGKKPCGCIVAAIADDGRDRERVATALRDWVRDGLTVERTTAAVVRQEFVGNDCPHEPRQGTLFAPESNAGDSSTCVHHRRS